MGAGWSCGYALACGKTVPMLVSANDDNWYCSGLLTSGFSWVHSWIGAETWVSYFDEKHPLFMERYSHTFSLFPLWSGAEKPCN